MGLMVYTRVVYRFKLLTFLPALCGFFLEKIHDAHLSYRGGWC
ncbi:hypothetical protein AB7M22_001289 [Pseudomonas sp. ADAK2 TE3594]